MYCLLYILDLRFVLSLCTTAVWQFAINEYDRGSAIAEGPRDTSYQLKSCQLTRNSAETTCTISAEQTEVMKLQGYSRTMCNKHVYSTMTRSSRFYCPIGVINKPTTDELCIWWRWKCTTWKWRTKKTVGLENARVENDGQTFSKLRAQLRGLENAGLENDGQTFSKLWARLRGLENAGVQV